MNYATIRANDDYAGKAITLSITPAEYDGEHGYAITSSNGDDVAHYRPQSMEKCQADIIAQWGNWATFEIITA